MPPRAVSIKDPEKDKPPVRAQGFLESKGESEFGLVFPCSHHRLQFEKTQVTKIMDKSKTNSLTFQR